MQFVQAMCSFGPPIPHLHRAVFVLVFRSFVAIRHDPSVINPRIVARQLDRGGTKIDAWPLDQSTSQSAWKLDSEHERTASDRTCDPRDHVAIGPHGSLALGSARDRSDRPDR